MNFPRFSIIPLLVLLTLSACDDGDKKKTARQPSLTLSTITVGEVLYQADPAGLGAQVTVHIVDDDGAAMPGVAVAVESLVDHSSTVTPDSVVTDAAGDAVFSVVGTSIGNIELVVHVSTEAVATHEDPILDATGMVNIDFSASVTPLDATYAWNQGDFTLRLSLQDAAGPITEAPITLMTNEADLLFDGEISHDYTTNTSGTVTLHATTPRSGLQEMTVLLGGMTNGKSVNVDFYGPRVSGTVTNAQVYPLAFRSARAAAMALNMTDPATIDQSDPIRGQVTSESVCPCPVPADFELTLPIMPDEALLLSDATRQVKYNYFPLVVHDDLDDDYLWNVGEPLLGARLSAGVLYYARPDGDNPSGPLGWTLVDTFADEPEALDWDFFSSSLDAFIRRSQVNEVHLSGTVDAAGADSRVALFVVNANAMTGYTPSAAWVTSMFDDLRADADQVLLLADIPVSGGTYDATMLAPVFSGSQAQDWEITWLTGNGDAVTGYLVIPVVYQDDNGNGALDTAEAVTGVVHSDAGTAEVVFWITDYPNYELFRDPNTLGLHLGFNRLRVSALLEILSRVTNAGDQVFTFGQSVPGPLADIPFRIFAGGEPLTGTPIVEGTFSTAAPGTEVTIPTATCSNCNTTGAGDTFLILAPQGPGQSTCLDWTSLNFTTGRP